MASENKTENVMLEGQVAYFKKDGAMDNLNTINVKDTSTSYSYKEGYVKAGSKIAGTPLNKTTEYKNCELDMRLYLENDFDNTTEGYTVENNAKNMLAKLQPKALNIENISNNIQLPSDSYEVINTSAPYKFILNKAGYYESNNQGIDRSCAKCRINFILNTGTKIINLECINSGESNFDFGLISNVDSTLTDTNEEDASVFKSFKGQSSTDAVNVSITIPVGKHYIEIKYRKDVSMSSGNDSFQFKIKNTDILKK